MVSLEKKQCEYVRRLLEKMPCWKYLCLTRVKKSGFLSWYEWCNKQGMPSRRSTKAKSQVRDRELVNIFQSIALGRDQRYFTEASMGSEPN